MSAANPRPAMESYESVFVARQPIFTPELLVWGYELLFRHSAQAHGGDGGDGVDGDLATARVIADGYALVHEGMDSSRKLLVNFPARSLVDDTARALPADRVVIEILETVEPVPAILDACRGLKAAGYLLALDDFVGQPGFEPLSRGPVAALWGIGRRNLKLSSPSHRHARSFHFNGHRRRSDRALLWSGRGQFRKRRHLPAAPRTVDSFPPLEMSEVPCCDSTLAEHTGDLVVSPARSMRVLPRAHFPSLPGH